METEEKKRFLFFIRVSGGLFYVTDRGKQTLNKFTVRQLFYSTPKIFLLHTNSFASTPHSSALLGKITFAQAVKSFPAFLGMSEVYFWVPKIMQFTPGVGRMNPDPFSLRSVV